MLAIARSLYYAAIQKATRDPKTGLLRTASGARNDGIGNAIRVHATAR